MVRKWVIILNLYKLNGIYVLMYVRLYILNVVFYVSFLLVFTSANGKRMVQFSRSCFFCVWMGGNQLPTTRWAPTRYKLNCDPVSL